MADTNEKNGGQQEASPCRRAPDQRSLTPASSSSTLYEDTGVPGSRPACFRNTFQECLFVLITTFAVAQNTLLTGSMRSLTALIGKDLNMNDAEITWIVASQTLTAGTFLLFFGRIADFFGRRLMLIVSMGIFSIFLLISGFATNAIFFDAFMGLCGLACAATVPPAIGKLGAVYTKPSPRKNRAFSCFGAGAPVGVVLGSLIAGIVTVITTWRAVLWVLAVIYALLTVLAWFVVPADTEQKTKSWSWQTLKQFDLVGTSLITGGCAALVAAFTEAGVAPGGWAASYVIALLVVGVVLIALLAYWEAVSDNPIIPTAPWRDRNFTGLVIMLCLGFYSFNCNTFWLTLVWQNVYHNSPLEVAVKFLPASIGGLSLCFTAAIIIHRVNNRLLSSVAAISFVVASALFSATSTGISYWALTFPGLLFSVLGQDFLFCITNLYVVSALPKEQQSIAGGIIQMTSRLSVAIGLGIQQSLYKATGGALHGNEATYYRPYQVTFWASLVGATFALGFLPFLTIGKQGRKEEPIKDEEEGATSNSA